MKFKWIYLSFSNLPFASLFSAICKASSDNHFAFLHVFFLEMVLITATCHEPSSIVQRTQWTWINGLSGLNGHEFEQTLGDIKDRVAQWAAVQGVAKSRTWLSDWTDWIRWNKLHCKESPAFMFHNQLYKQRRQTACLNSSMGEATAWPRPGAVAGRTNPTSKEPWLRGCRRT